MVLVRPGGLSCDISSINAGSTTSMRDGRETDKENWVEVCLWALEIPAEEGNCGACSDDKSRVVNLVLISGY